MHVLRPIELRDEKKFVDLAMSATLGILSLPQNPERLRQKLRHAVETFARTIPPFEHGNYLFVLENTETHAIEGCSAITSTTESSDIVSYCYKIDTWHHPHPIFEQIPPEQKLLVPHILPKNASEIGSLFLKKNVRKEGLGKLLSLGRFLFIGCHREYFQKIILVEMRGVIDDNGNSPFWEGIGRHFCDVNFETITELCEANPLIAKEIQARYPLYINILPYAVQNVIGKTHEHSLPALKMLLDQGFSPINAIDIFDGGLKLSAPVNKIKTIRSSIQTLVKAISTEAFKGVSNKQAIITTTKRAFRACYGNAHITQEGATISMETAKALQIDVGENICLIELKEKSHV